MADASKQLPRLVKVPGGAPNMDQTLEDADVARLAEQVALKQDLPMRVRMQPGLYIYSPQVSRYVGMQGMVWVLELTDAQQVKALMDDLQGFLEKWTQNLREGAQ